MAPWQLIAPAKVFNMSGDARAVARDISKAFVGVWHTGLLPKR